MAASGILDLSKLSILPKDKKMTTFLDLPINIKKKILAYNGDEQIIWHFTNECDEDTFLTLGRDPLHMDEPAPRSLWNMALVCKQLLNELFPVIPQAINQDNNDPRFITYFLLRYAVVNLRSLRDIYDGTQILEEAGILPLLSVLRLWMRSSMDAVQVFMLPRESVLVGEWIAGLEECWPHLDRLDLMPMVLPPYDDTRFNHRTGEAFIVPRYTWMLEQVREADNLPGLAERPWNQMLWRSFCWTRDEHPVSSRSPPRDQWGMAEADCWYESSDDGYN